MKKLVFVAGLLFLPGCAHHQEPPFGRSVGYPFQKKKKLAHKGHSRTSEHTWFGVLKPGRGD